MSEKIILSTRFYCKLENKNVYNQSNKMML